MQWKNTVHKWNNTVQGIVSLILWGTATRILFHPKQKCTYITLSSQKFNKDKRRLAWSQDGHTPHARTHTKYLRNEKGLVQHLKVSAALRLKSLSWKKVSNWNSRSTYWPNYYCTLNRDSPSPNRSKKLLTITIFPGNNRMWNCHNVCRSIRGDLRILVCSLTCKNCRLTVWNLTVQ